MSYHISYDIQVHPDGIERKDLDGRGACDSLGIVSVIEGADGTSSQVFTGKDGQTGAEWSDAKWFAAWSLLARKLADSSTLGEGQRHLCREVFEMIREAVVSAREE